MRISDWSSDVCSSDLARHAAAEPAHTLHEDDERIAILARAQGEQERQLGIKARREAPAYAETEQKRGDGDEHGDGNACAAGDEVDSPVGIWGSHKDTNPRRKETLTRSC